MAPASPGTRHFCRIVTGALAAAEPKSHLCATELWMVRRVKEIAAEGRALAPAGALTGLRGALARWFVPAGLSARLLVLTLLFVLVSEVFIYVPSIASYRLTLLRQKRDTAELAALALVANGDQGVGPGIREELLANAGAVSVALTRNDQRLLLSKPGQLPPSPAKVFDLKTEGGLKSVADAF